VEAAVAKACLVAVAGPVVVPVVVEEEDSVAGPVVVPAVAVEVAADAAAVAAEGDSHVNISINHNKTDEGGRNDTSGNAG